MKHRNCEICGLRTARTEYNKRYFMARFPLDEARNQWPTVTMTSASSSSARSLFAESKQRLAERVQVNMNNISSLARQIQRGSKSNELLMKSARDMANTEHQMESSEENLRKMQLISVHMGYQYENILKSAQMLSEIKEQVANMRR